MTYEIVSADEYQMCLSDKNIIVFNNRPFVELNKTKVERIDYIILKQEESSRFAFAFGVCDNMARFPFSAPFALPVEIKKEQSVVRYDEALFCLEQYCRDKCISSLRIIFPPMFYASESITAWINSMYRDGYVSKNIDINYAIDLQKMFASDYDRKIQYKGRKNLHIAQKQNLDLIYCETQNAIEKAYDIILQNRTSKGYPLRMSLKQVLSTIKIVPHDVFIVRKDSECIAAALVYTVADKIAQVIYWGDSPGHETCKSINFLAYELIQYYGKRQYRWLDIGPSTENSIPNYGLCDFKESIGCQRSLKFTMEKTFE